MMVSVNLVPPNPGIPIQAEIEVPIEMPSVTDQVQALEV